MHTTEHPIIFFDSDCGLCHWAVVTCLNWDTSHIIRFAPLKGKTAKRHLPATYLSLDTVVLLKNSVFYTKSNVIIQLLDLLNKPILATICRLFPRAIRDHMYDYIAQHRLKFIQKKHAPNQLKGCVFLD